MAAAARAARAEGPRAGGARAAGPRVARALRAAHWWAPAALALAVGYADLWRGGETLAPALLALGYVVLVPLAVLRR